MAEIEIKHLGSTQNVFIRNFMRNFLIDFELHLEYETEGKPEVGVG